jgi:hypothetical protein
MTCSTLKHVNWWNRGLVYLNSALEGFNFDAARFPVDVGAMFMKVVSISSEAGEESSELWRRRCFYHYQTFD